MSTGSTALTDHLTPGAAAAILGITVDYVRQLAAAGRLTAIVTPAGRLYVRADVEALRDERLARREAGPRPGRPTRAQRAARERY